MTSGKITISFGLAKSEYDEAGEEGGEVVALIDNPWLYYKKTIKNFFVLHAVRGSNNYGSVLRPGLRSRHFNVRLERTTLAPRNRNTDRAWPSRG